MIVRPFDSRDDAAENPAPNRVLEKLGFQFIKRYRCVPGAFNLEQHVNRYEIERGIWEARSNTVLQLS